MTYIAVKKCGNKIKCRPAVTNPGVEMAKQKGLLLFKRA